MALLRLSWAGGRASASSSMESCGVCGCGAGVEGVRGRSLKWEEVGCFLAGTHTQSGTQSGRGRDRQLPLLWIGREVVRG